MTEHTLYQNINFLLKKYNTGLSGSELHGMLTGFFVTGCSKKECFSLITDFANDGIHFPDEFSENLNQMYNTINTQFSHHAFEFQLLLENKNVSLEQQIEDISNWISQFLFSIGIIKQQFEDITDDVKEVINDLNQLALLKYEESDLEQISKSEKMLKEIVEYVRIAVILCYEEFVNSKKTSDVLH